VGSRTLGTWVDNIKMDLGELDGVLWIGLIWFRTMTRREVL
jgi:hypothetical protein